MAGILAASEIRRRIAAGDIFMPDTYNDANVRGARYDLRMAADGLVGPDSRKYPPGMRRGQPIVLNPGQTAFVTTAERLALPWDLAGTIGPKFDLANRGLLLMTGLNVDPGYGLEPDDKGGWRKAGARLHFGVANQGTQPISLIPEETRIASIQFLLLEGAAEHKAIRAPVEAQLFTESADELTAGLAFVESLGRLREEVGQLRDTLESQGRDLTSGLSSIDRLVGFGYLLIASTLFVTAFAAVLSFGSNASVIAAVGNLTAALPNDPSHALAWFGVAVVIAAVVIRAPDAARLVGRVLARFRRPI